MLGIIFTGGQGPKARIVKRLLETEIKDAKTQKVLIVAADSGLIAAQDAGIKPDWIIGDMDSLDDSSCLSAYPPECVIRHSRDKDFTDTELAFNLAEEKGCDETWIIGGGGGRIDHLFGIRSMFERERVSSRWITDNEDIHCIESAEKSKKNEVLYALQKDACVSIFPLGEGPWEAKSEGLKWPLDNVKWSRGFFGLSNVAVDGKFSVTAKTGRFMVILPLYNI